MKQPLPVEQFQVGNGSNCGQKVIFAEYFDLNHKRCEISINLEEILNSPKEADIGYAVEVDIEYLEYLHDAHSEYRLAR